MEVTIKERSGPGSSGHSLRRGFGREAIATKQRLRPAASSWAPSMIISMVRGLATSRKSRMRNRPTHLGVVHSRHGRLANTFVCQNLFSGKTEFAEKTG